MTPERLRSDSSASRACADQGREQGKGTREGISSSSPSIQRRVPARELAETMDGQTDLPLDRLREAEQAMTPGPWWGGTGNRRKNGIGLVSVGRNEDAAPIAVLAGARQTIADRGANTAGIVLLRNHAAGLIDQAEELAQLRALIAAIPQLCDWLADFKDARAVDHAEFHYGSPCPYADVVPAFLAGRPDPRRLLAERQLTEGDTP